MPSVIEAHSSASNSQAHAFPLRFPEKNSQEASMSNTIISSPPNVIQWLANPLMRPSR
jgi:hypothetical protein